MLDLYRAELKRSWIILKRYPLEGISTLILTLFSCVLFLTAGPWADYVDYDFENGVIGYTVWTLITIIFDDIALTLSEEAMTGTLEQVFLTPHGITRLFGFRTLASLGINLIILAIILFILMLLTGSWLAFPPVLVLPLSAIITGAFGLAYALGSLALLFKRVRQVIILSEILLLLIVMTPVENLGGASRTIGFLLPFTPGLALLRSLMANEQPFDAGLFAIALANGLVYLAVGVLLLRRAVAVARHRGLV
ncbi:MAG: hypothetical protein M1157_09080, partial [Deinococcus sp.]|nr:hypothetical protein [Deinococcus sp.]